MRKYISGYNTIDLTSNDVYTQALNACVLTNKKPTFIYDGSNVSIVNTIVLNDDSTITINGELTIATNGTLTPSGWKIKTPHLFLNRIMLNGKIDNKVKQFMMLVYDKVEYTSEMIEQNPTILDNFDSLPICNINTGGDWFFENLFIYDGHLEGNVYNQGEEQGFDTATLSLNVSSIQIF